MSEVKQVKVDNWGIYFLQRLKHFFNRTDYCDLTLQFQDNAQLKVHRLVLSACTEYFELLERTCEMYEDCLVMPDDLQADVVVPIINFMYTGQLEYKMDLLEKLYQTSLIMNMPVLTKLLASHRVHVQPTPRPAANNYYGKRYVKQCKSTPPSSTNATNKRSYSSAFSNSETPKSKKPSTMNKIETPSNSKNSSQDLGESQVQFPVFYEKNNQLTKGARPTRYELPEELDEDNAYDNSFTSISYTSKPLMVHPDTTKQYRSKRINLFEEGSSTSRFIHNNDIVECKKITVNSNNIFLDESSDMVTDDNDIFQQSPSNKEEIKDSNQLFDQIIENDVSNITIETKNKQSGNLDHAKIISEVLKKYPHLVKSNKQIKLKILNTAASKTKKPRANISHIEDKEKIKTETRDFTYETDVIDSKEAARLIALGAENVKGPWICLICGTPGKALHFTKYYNFRKHLVEVHNEKPVPNICEYCGLKSQKRNYLVHHQLTKHGVEPPSHYNFPKCNYCDYIALNEALLVKHKITHTDISNYKRNICNAAFAASLMDGVQKPNNKQTSYEKKSNLVCMYCLRVFLRQNNLYAHLKTNHKEAAKSDGLIYDSEEENAEEEDKIYKSKSNDITNFIKLEVPVNYDYEDVQYQLERRSDGNIHVVSKKPRVVMPASKHKILNPGFITQQQTLPSLVKPQPKTKTLNTPTKRNEFIQEICLSPSNNVNQEEIVVIDNNEYIVRDFQLFPKTSNTENKEESIGTIVPTTSMEFHNVHSQIPETKMFIKKSSNLNQPLQIVVSNEEEYKTLINSNQSVIFDDTDSGKTLTVLAAADNSTMETGTINLSNTQPNEMMIIPDDFSINVSEAVSGDNSNIVVVYSHPVEDPNKQYQLIATREVGLEFVQSSEILTQTFETVTTCSTVATTQTTGEHWPSNIQATISKLPITSAADLQTMTVAESVTVPCETVSSNLNEYPNVTLPSNEPVPMDTGVIASQEQRQPDEANVISNIEQSIVSSCGSKPDMVLDQQIIEANNIHQPPISRPDIQSSVHHVETTVVTDLISTPTVEVQPLISHHSSDLDMVTGNPQDTTNSEPVVNVIVPEMEIQHTTGMDNIESVIENVQNANIDVHPTNTQIPEDTETLLTSSGDHIVSQEIPIVADVINEIQKIEVQAQEQTTEEMEVAETIENIARNIGVDPNSINKEIQSDMPQILTDTETINSENIKLKTVPNEQIQSLTSEWSEDESEIAVLNDKNVNPEHRNENIAEMSKTFSSHLNSELSNDKSIEVEESIENIRQEIQRHAGQENIAKTDDVNSLPDANVNITVDEPGNEESIVKTPVISNPKISSLLHDWDDNDSQEEDSTATEIKTEESTPTIENNDLGTVKKEEEDLSNNDKIKSLVSDWDEDDEDNKD